MAAIKMLDELSEKELDSWKESYDAILKEEYADNKDKADELIWTYNLLRDKISPILWGSLVNSLHSTIHAGDQIQKIIEDTYAELLQHAKKRKSRPSGAGC
jgi:hypothetical protein